MTEKELLKWLVEIQNKCFVPFFDKEEIFTDLEELIYQIKNEGIK